MNLKNTINKIFENHGKYRAMIALRALPENVLQDVGISQELLAQGIKAWPWTAIEDNWEPRRSGFKQPVRAEMANFAERTDGESAANNTRTAA